MPLYACLMTALIAAGPRVDAVGLDGEVHSGALVGIQGETIRLQNDQDTVESLNSADLRTLEFPGVEAPDPFADPPAIEVWLVDGSRLAATAFTAQLNEVTLTVEELGEIKIPRNNVRAVRLAASDDVATRWAELLQRDNQADMLVVLKETSLDFVEGSVGDVTASEISFLLQEQIRALPRDRAFGIVYARTTNETPRPVMQTHVGRNVLQLASLSISTDAASANLAAGAAIPVPLDRLRLIEFSGRIRYLAEFEVDLQMPAGVAENERYRYYRRGNEPFGAPLRIGSEEVIATEGLWIHSGVVARYRINRDYRRLLALVGMDHNVGGDRSVRLVIAGDGRTLLDEIIRWSEEAQEIDLEVAGVRDLEIRVERLPEGIKDNIFGIQEHLDLGNIRLVR